jgi:hypothetical protein
LRDHAKTPAADFASSLEAANQGRVQIFGKIGVKTALKGAGSAPNRRAVAGHEIAALGSN